MFDVNKALEWSRLILRKGGMFYMDDFVGPSRFQWSDSSLELASRIRSLLSPEYLVNPYDPEVVLSKTIRRPDPKAIEKAPSRGPKCDERMAMETPWKNRIIPITWAIFRLEDPSGANSLIASMILCQMAAMQHM